MKIRFLTLFILFFCFSMFSAAQNNDFEVKVFSQDSGSDKNNKSVSLVVKRKNNAEFDTNRHIDIWLYLLKCPTAENCKGVDGIYSATGSVKGEKLAKTETLALRMNLNEFYWRPAMSSIDVLGYRAPNFSEVPKENIYFYVKINVCKKPETKEKEPVCAEYTSNEIVLNP